MKGSGFVSILDVSNFVELLSLQNGRTLNDDIGETVSTTPLAKYIEIKKEEEYRKEIESKYSPEKLPKKYFFSYLAEDVLS